MRVTIQFHGLCFFVPRNDKVYVLLPATGTGIPPHTAVFLYSGSYDRPVLTTSHILPFAGLELVFQGLQGDHAYIQWESGLQDITPITGVTVAPENITGVGAVAARVVLDAGLVAPTANVACWDIDIEEDGATRKVQIGLTDVVTFTGWVAGTTLRWGVRDLGTAEEPEWVEIDGGNAAEIKLEVQHLTRYVHDVDPKPGETRADHFGAYFELLLPGNRAQIPVFRNTGPCTATRELIARLKSMSSATLYTCMVGGGS